MWSTAVLAIIAVAMGAIVGCDGAGQLYVPEANPDNMYFYPLNPGESAKYLHEHQQRNSYLGINYRTLAILEWTVTDTFTQDGLHVITMKETLRGNSEDVLPDGTVEIDTINYDATRYATFHEDRLVFPPYTDYVDSWHWSYPEETQDTVWIDVFMGGTLDYTRSKQVALVKELGLYEWYSGTAGLYDDWDLLKRILD